MHIFDPFGDGAKALGLTTDSMKLLYTSDLHGHDSHYARLMTIAGQFRPEVVVLGGDLLPDENVMEPSKMGQGQPLWVRTQFRKAIGTLRDVSGCLSVLVIFGNHDWGSSATAMRELAQEGLLSILDLTHVANLQGLNFVGYSCTPPTPFYVKDFERLDQTGDTPPLLGGARWDPRFGRPSTAGATVIYKAAPPMSEELAAFKAPAAPWVFVCHAPPYDCGIDQTQAGQPGGSKAVRQAIEKHQPLLSLHGHIHESYKMSGRYRAELGRTIAVNPGQSSGALHHLKIEIELPAGRLRALEHGKLA